MFTVTINSASITTKSGVSGRTGRPYAIHEQPAIVDLPNGERRAITLQHDLPDGPALVAGTYKPKDTAGTVGNFGSLEVSTRARHWQLVDGKTAQASPAKP